MQLPQDLRAGEAVLVSACVLGEAVRYDGGADLDAALLRALETRGVRIVPVCPEVLGGLGVPRPAAEPRTGDGRDVWRGAARVHTVEDGVDVTGAFLAGARAALAIARETGARYAFLKERSPSCGVEASHSGGGLVAGPGVTTAALRAAGLQVFPAGS
ncbi:MAG TPA: DUF523 domain-containing protein [Planctomycetota bacterium]